VPKARLKFLTQNEINIQLDTERLSQNCTKLYATLFIWL